MADADTPAGRLEARRKELKFETAAQLARARGWNVRTYQAHEAGTKPLSKEAQERYARSLGLSLDYLVTGKRHGKWKMDPEEMPPLDLRRIPVLTLGDVLQIRSVSEMLKIKTNKSAFVSNYSNLSEKTRSFIALDDAMVSPDSSSKKNIPPGSEIIFDPDKPYEPGEIVAALLFNPTRMIARRYGELRDEQGTLIVRLFPAASHHAEQRITSPADGFILGRVMRVQAGSDF